MSGSLNAFVTALASAVSYQNGKLSYIEAAFLMIMYESMRNFCESMMWRCLRGLLLSGEELRKLLSVSNQHALEAVRQVRLPFLLLSFVLAFRETLPVYNTPCICCLSAMPHDTLKLLSVSNQHALEAARQVWYVTSLLSIATALHELHTPKKAGQPMHAAFSTMPYGAFEVPLLFSVVCSNTHAHRRAG